MSEQKQEEIFEHEPLPTEGEEQQEPVVEGESSQEETAQQTKAGWKDKFKKEDPREVELKKLQDDYAALNDKHLRLLAEYDNFRKRSQRERDAIYPEATASAVISFLSVADNFERALAAECTDPEYKKGAEMTFKSLCDAFSKLGVEALGAVGDPFDPNCHNAVMHIEDESLEPGTISEVFQKGYRLGERVLRPAMVKVAN